MTSAETCRTLFVCSAACSAGLPKRFRSTFVVHTGTSPHAMPDFRAGDYRLTDDRRTSKLDPATSVTQENAQLAENQRASHAGVVSFLSSNEREGRWQVPRHFRALAVLGNVELDLREAEIGYGLSVIEAVAVLGNVEIKVLPDISVECDGDSLMGTFTLKYQG